MPTAEELSEERATQRAGLRWWGLVNAAWAIWCALWATGATSLFVFNYAVGIPVELGPFPVVIPALYLVSYGCWRLSRRLYRDSRELR
jgi:hypothetical protein